MSDYEFVGPACGAWYKSPKGLRCALPALHPEDDHECPVADGVKVWHRRPPNEVRDFHLTPSPDSGKVEA